jgi:hypothetical protein
MELSDSHTHLRLFQVLIVIHVKLVRFEVSTAVTMMIIISQKMIIITLNLITF